MSKAILKKTNRKVAVKLYGSALNETVTLATDCKLANETLDTVRKVSILGVTFTGAIDAFATITRNGVVIMTLQANAAGTIQFIDADFNESVENTSDIVVTSTGLMQVYLLLRKESGYLSNIDDGLSIYDNPNTPGV